MAREYLTVLSLYLVRQVYLVFLKVNNQEGSILKAQVAQKNSQRKTSTIRTAEEPLFFINF